MQHKKKQIAEKKIEQDTSTIAGLAKYLETNYSRDEIIETIERSIK